MADIRLYLHFEGTSGHTHIVKLRKGDPTTVAELARQFCDSYKTKHGDHNLTASSLQLLSSNGSLLKDSTVAAQVFKDRDDAFLQLDPDAPDAPPSTNAATDRPAAAKPAPSQPQSIALTASASGRTSVSSAASSSSKSKQTKQASTRASADSALNDPKVEKTFQHGQQAYAQKQYRAAASIYAQVLEVAPGHKDCLKALTELWQTVGRQEAALKLARQAVQLHPRDPTLRRLLGDCLCQVKQPEAGLKEYQRGLEIAKEDGLIGVDELGLNAGIAGALYAVGGSCRELAANLVMDVLKQDEMHVGALFLYAKIAMETGSPDDGLRALLRLLIKAPQDDKLRRMLADCLRQERCFVLLRDELSSSGQGAQQALAFLATAVKDHGAVATAIRLYRWAVELQPTNANHVLNLMHTLELEQRYSAVLDAARAYLQATQVLLGGGLILADVVRALEGVRFQSTASPSGGLPTEPRDLHQPGSRQEAHVNGGTSSAEAEEVEIIRVQEEYDGSQLDTLAILFTTVKVLFVCGAPSRVAALVALVEPARLASKRELHTTLIRNEAAYFGCVGQIMRDYPPPALDPAAAPQPLYLCGDSHCLSGAWQTVHLRGKLRVLVPALVTGCKVWHMRPASDFYPKVNFFNTVNSLPKGAQVIMMFGEIDCREGLLLAVERLKYESTEEGIQHTVSIYIQVLLDLMASRGFEIFVHPVAPVLDPTRHIVRPYNRALKQQVLEAAKTPAAKGKLHWLDFFQDLLSADGRAFNPDLEFDGTHMAPSYVKFLDAQLSAVP